MFGAARGNYWRAAVAALISVVLLAPVIVGLVRLWFGPAYPAGAGAVVPMIIFFLLIAPLTPLMEMYTLVRRERALRAALRGDEEHAPRAIPQPSPALALRDDERLVLRRTINLQTVWWWWMLLGPVGAVVFAVFLAVIGELCVYLVAPHAAGWIVVPFFSHGHAPFQFPPRTLTPMEWLVNGLVAVPGCALVIWWLPSHIMGYREAIVADQTGIAVRRFIGGRRFVPWDDIRLVIAAGPDPSQPASLLLRGERHGIVLNVSTQPPPPHADGRPQPAAFLIEGGADAYRARVGRLASTIVARGHVPIRTWARPELGSARGRVPLPTDLTPDEVQRMPLAYGALQPRVAAVEGDGASSAQPGEVVSLRAAIPTGVLVRRVGVTYFIFCGLLVVMLGLMALLRMVDLRRIGAVPLFSQPWVAAGLLLLFFLLAWLLAVATYRDYVAPTVVADAAGVQLRKFNGMPSATMLWKDVRAWAVLEPDDVLRVPPTYALFSDQQTLTWQEPLAAGLAEGSRTEDRREAYAAEAQRLHIMIARRTGLPLHQIVPRPEV